LAASAVEQAAEFAKLSDDVLQSHAGPVLWHRNAGVSKYAPGQKTQAAPLLPVVAVQAVPGKTVPPAVHLASIAIALSTHLSGALAVDPAHVPLPLMRMPRHVASATHAVLASVSFFFPASPSATHAASPCASRRIIPAAVNNFIAPFIECAEVEVVRGSLA